MKSKNANFSRLIALAPTMAILFLAISVVDWLWQTFVLKEYGLDAPFHFFLLDVLHSTFVLALVLLLCKTKRFAFAAIFVALFIGELFEVHNLIPAFAYRHNLFPTSLETGGALLSFFWLIFLAAYAFFRKTLPKHNRTFADVAVLFYTTAVILDLLNFSATPFAAFEYGIIEEVLEPLGGFVFLLALTIKQK